ncbi:acyltransferase family protein [Caulobacter sp. DWP3-1-3b2]|uniref:acyltransferase family protein n=1 Tax=Caulobacter sp. DWP3-1-3b2 TaxID=2804643 RepID=UPI003CF20A91
MEHRHDINGLRAIAVIAVLFFHFNIAGFQGGFAGVDVFYNISGFLMTKIILNGLENKSFELGGFVGARARRIVPALAAMGFFMLAIGFFVLDSQSYRDLALDTLSSDFFVSNFKFFREQGYFDSNSNTKWMLHTWSTSLEWQFYLIYPLSLMIISRLSNSRYTLQIALWTGFVTSLALGIWFTTTHQAAAFYLLPFRAWEMIIGGLVATHALSSTATETSTAPARRVNLMVVHFIGLALIAFSIIRFNPATPWPSYWAAVPVLGSSLVLIARQKDIGWAQQTVIKSLGAWSYSIYIWHWPVLVLSRYLNLPVTIASQLALMTIIFVLAYLSYELIEKPFQGRRDGSQTRLYVHPRIFGLGAVWLVTIGFGVVVALSDGLPTRRSVSPILIKDYAAASSDRAFPEKCSWDRTSLKVKPCVVGEPNKDIVFIGDSHAEMLYPRFAANPQGRSYTFLTLGGCPPLPGVRKAREAGSQCDQFVDQALTIATSGRYRRVVLAAFWPVYLEAPSRDDEANANQLCFLGPNGCQVEADPAAYSRALDAAFDKLARRLSLVKAQGGEVVILLPTPYSRLDIPREIRKRLFWGQGIASVSNLPRAEVDAVSAESRRRLMALAQQLDARVVDPAPWLCSTDQCPLTDPMNRSYYVDSNHIRASVVKTPRFGYLDVISAR